ncbi:MAG TPA: hypothetical protein VFD31_01425 [Thermoleophilaceae bacterium]|nr:hypothetical protein [Thermoleophilaceae bacterium]
MTFSVPTYRIARKRSTVRVRASVGRRVVRLSTAPAKACRRRACKLSVYKIRNNLSGRVARVALVRSNRRGASVARVRAAKPPRDSSYIVALRRGKKLLTSSRGIVR